MTLTERVEALEDQMLQIQMLIKILKPVAIMLGASVGMDLSALIV
jgi:hypothetical protein|tara:strand:+ start:2255 stop:2389 length:135 start_codon:yes stop_codon:yes gene_type:complete